MLTSLRPTVDITAVSARALLSGFLKSKVSWDLLSSHPGTAEVRLEVQAAAVGPHKAMPGLQDDEGVAEDMLYGLWLRGWDTTVKGLSSGSLLTHIASPLQEVKPPSSPKTHGPPQFPPRTPSSP